MGKYAVLLLLLVGIASCQHRQRPDKEDPYLERLLASPNDFLLCDEICSRIQERCDAANFEELSRLPAEHRVVLDVWGSVGVIGNAGFSGFFMWDHADLTGVADSFEEIGARRIASTMREALTVFPGSKPQADIEERYWYLEKLDDVAKEKERAYLDFFFESDREIQRKLAAYIRNRRDAYASTFPTQWEDLHELEKQDLAPPPKNAPDAKVAEWLESIDISITRESELSEAAEEETTEPKSPSPILELRLSDRRNSTDWELEQMAGYEVLKDVRSISLVDTYVTSKGLRHLRRFPNLETLDLQCTDTVDSWLEELIHMARLKELNLSGLEIKDAGLKAVSRVGTLEILWLWNTNVTDEGLRSLASLTKLRQLLLLGTRVAGPGLHHLSDLPLDYLSLNALKSDGQEFSALAHFCNLTGLELDGTRAGDETLKYIASCRKLEWLGLSGTRVTDSGLIHLAHLVELRTLHLGNTDVGGNGLTFLSDLVHLESLDLSNTRVTDEDLSSLQKLTALKELRLDETPVTDSAIRHLVGLSQLESLSVRAEGVRGTQALRQIAELPSLRCLTLPENLAEGKGEHVRYLVETLPELNILFF